VAALATIRATGSLVGTVGAMNNLAQLQVLQGRLRAAAATYGELLQLVDGPAELHGLHGGLGYFVGLGDLHREWNDLDAADSYVTRAMELLPDTLTVEASYVVLGYLTLARLQHARGEHAAAHSTLMSLIQLARQRGFASHLITRGAAVQAQLALAAGNLSAAVAWADASGLHAEDTVTFPREAEYLILARVWIAQANTSGSGSLLPQAFQLLDRLLEDATAKARIGSMLEILIVRALAHWAQGAREDALATIERALVLAEPEGYIRRFVDEGPAVAALLRAVLPQRVTPDYIARLLAAFPGSRDDASGASTRIPAMWSSQPAPAAPFYEPGSERLSLRELEVLRLMASGKSNAEIARVLVVAVSTVKSHTNSIFGKLEVTSRSDAILRAREMRLL
jgi:LuxR family maltose regulon positive regulatory protein